MTGYYKYNLHEKIENEINVRQEIINKDVVYLSKQIEKNQSLENIEEAMYRKLNTVDDLVRYLESKRCN